MYKNSIIYKKTHILILYSIRNITCTEIFNIEQKNVSSVHVILYTYYLSISNKLISISILHSII